MVDKKAPELRFKGFTEDWEQCKLGEEVDIFDGTHQTPEYTDEGVKFVSVENISTLETKKYISLTAYEQEYHKKQAEKGDVLMTRIGDVGTSKVIDTAEPLAYYVTLALLKPKEITSDFLAWLIESPEVQRNIWKRTLHIAFPKKINLGEINQIDIFLPNIDEQLKIGDFLKRLDYTITLHQRKLDQLKDLKQAYLQQLFPSDGEYAPKVRFANFNRDWELCKLNKLANIIGGGTPSTGVEEYWNGDIDWYSPVEIGSQIFLRGSQKKITEVGLQKSSAKVLPVGTVLFTSRAGIGNTAILAKEGTTNQGFQSIVPHSGKLDTYFTYSRTHELKQYGEITGAGSTFIEVSGKQMAKMPIKVPRFEEQAKIGSFFKKLDDIITLHQQKLSKLERLKAAYLQKMFI